MSSVLVGMIAYVLLQFAIGVWVSRRMGNETDYILAGRSLGTLLVAFSVFATWFGAEAIVATSGEVYDKGVSGALVDPFGYAAAVIISGLLFAAALWRRGLTTFADLFRERYSPAVEKLVVIMLLPGSVIWAAAQIRAFGQILSASSGFTLTTAITIAAVLVAAYAVVGGLLADAVTDFLQGVAVIIGLLALAVVIAASVGGLGKGLAQVAPQRLSVLAALREDPLHKIEQMVIAICGSLVAVELISRYLGARSAQIARSGTIIGGLMYLALGLIPIFLGLMAAVLADADPGLKAKIAGSEQVIAVLAEHTMPRWHYVFFAGAMISAILSVVHAALHAPAAQISHNIVLRVVPGLDDHAKLWAVRLAVMALSGVAFLLALSSERIKDLVETASSFGSAGVFVTALFAIFSRFGGPASAIGSILSGVLVWMLGRFVLGWTAPYLVALAFAFLTYVAVAKMQTALSGRATSAAR